MKSKFVVKVSSKYNKPYIKTIKHGYFYKDSTQIRYKDYEEYSFLTDYTFHNHPIRIIRSNHYYYDSKKEAKESILADSNCKDYTEHLISRTYEIIKVYTND